MHVEAGQAAAARGLSETRADLRDVADLDVDRGGRPDLAARAGPPGRPTARGRAGRGGDPRPAVHGAAVTLARLRWPDGWPHVSERHLLRRRGAGRPAGLGAAPGARRAPGASTRTSWGLVGGHLDPRRGVRARGLPRARRGDRGRGPARRADGSGRSSTSTTPRRTAPSTGWPCTSRPTDLTDADIVCHEGRQIVFVDPVVVLDLPLTKARRA